MQVQKRMVRSRFKVLLAERNLTRLRAGQPELSMRDVAEETGLSLSTLALLAVNRTKRADYTTLNTLCTFFGCTPGDLLEYTPDEKVVV